VELTNFPFLQNAEMTSKDDFIQFFISQVYGLEKSTPPIDANGFPLQINYDQDVNFPKLDSIRYTNFNHTDFYFGKVNGYYRLVEIITPG